MEIPERRGGPIAWFVHNHVAANLAMVFAESQQRVLVIDACPGRASLTRTFGIEPDEAGLYEQLQAWLDGSNQPWEVVRVAETLAVVPASAARQPALPLLSSEAFTRFINDMTQLYDTLIIDTQAMQSASDAVVLQQRVDGYVVVAGRNRSTTHGVRQLASRLNPQQLLGVVLNNRG